MLNFEGPCYSRGVTFWVISKNQQSHLCHTGSKPSVGFGQPFCSKTFQKIHFTPCSQENILFKVRKYCQAFSLIKLKSLPYTHTDHPPTYPPITLNYL